MIQRVVLTAATGNERQRIFDVLECHLETETGHLTLRCRDGRVCLGLVGAWHLDVQPAPFLAHAHSCEEVERIHDGKTAVVLSVS